MVTNPAQLIINTVRSDHTTVRWSDVEKEISLMIKKQFSKENANPYNPDVAHHIINQLSKLLLRTLLALGCGANESVLTEFSFISTNLHTFTVMFSGSI